MTKSWKDHHKGVEVRSSDYSNDATICYHGLLSSCGADQVFLHYGFGGEHWQDTNTEKMNRTYNGWEKNVRLKNQQVNFCFKDSADHWDNNSGLNWTIR